jgi:hypothetical protein
MDGMDKAPPSTAPFEPWGEKMTFQAKPLSIALAALAVAAAASPAFALNQPHMQAAVDALNKAHAELTVATRDKAGHRARALQLVDQALNEARMGMAAGEAHEALEPRPRPR